MEGGSKGGGAEGWGGGAAKWPKIALFFSVSHSHVRSFTSLSESLLVELWSRVAATDHTK